MPSYKITARNSFDVNGRRFFVARTRYMDDGMQVFECVGGTAKAVSGFWGCLLLPDRQRKLPCREVARRMVTAWLDCNQWMPTPEQMEEMKQLSLDNGWCFSEEKYLKCFRHFRDKQGATAQAAPEKTYVMVKVVALREGAAHQFMEEQPRLSQGHDSESEDYARSSERERIRND